MAYAAARLVASFQTFNSDMSTDKDAVLLPSVMNTREPRMTSKKTQVPLFSLYWSLPLSLQSLDACNWNLFHPSGDSAPLIQIEASIVGFEASLGFERCWFLVDSVADVGSCSLFPTSAAAVTRLLRCSIVVVHVPFVSWLYIRAKRRLLLSNHC